jgi:phosphoribosylformimino-5-aminoimidazole carboxamide ribotide isomerase
MCRIQLIPSMDLLAGRIVRLRKGELGSAETYPFTADEWVERLAEAGALRIHLVDLEGAFGKQRQAAFADFPKRYPHIRFQLGGGLRTADAVAAVLGNGFDAVVGTLAVETPLALKGMTTQGGPQIIAALDMRGDQVQLRGWTAGSARPAQAIATDLQEAGVLIALVTDVDRDGMLEGPGTAVLAAAAAWGMRLQASGGVKSLDDLAALASNAHIDGAISGKALLDGLIDLRDPATQIALRGPQP